MRYLPGLFAALLLLWAGAVAAGEPPAAPMLRIETGMHTAKITRIDRDAAGHHLVTAGHDKTARIWSLVDGRLLRVLRPPIGPGDDGRLEAVAISPDGATVATAGWTGWDWDGAISVYLFDSATGALTRRLTGLTEVVLDLAFSPDGRHLAAGLSAGHGLRVWRVADGALVASDPDYGDSIYGLAFLPDGGLVTTGFDGRIRRYDRAFAKVADVRAPGGDHPLGIAVSPDGRRIAVGDNVLPHVDVLAATDLRPLFRPDLDGIDNGTIDSVAWSADGATLHAGGLYQNSIERPILAWRDGGRGPRRALRGSADTVMDLVALPDGRLAYGSADPAWGLRGPDGHPLLDIGAGQADFRAQLSRLGVSADGRRVRFGFGYGGHDPAEFDLAARTLTRNPPPAWGLTVAIPSTPTMVTRDWEDDFSPRLNDRLLVLDSGEPSRSAAVAGDRLLLGTEWYLRLFDRTGAQLWQTVVPGIAWAVTVTPDHRLAVAGLADGTVRWYRMTDGAELLALYPRPDGRWIAWTPQGYYDSSAGGERLVGWQVNRGAARAADFFPVDRFRDRFRRPDVIARVLDTLDVESARAQADAAAGRQSEEVNVEDILPPVIEILAPAPDSIVNGDKITLRYEVRAAADAPVRDVQVLVDGRPLGQGRGLQRLDTASRTGEIQVPLPPATGRPVTLSLISSNRHGTSSPAIVSVRRPDSAAGGGDWRKPDLFVLAVGVSAYADESLRLNFAAKDARDFARTIAELEGGLYRRVHVRLLPDATGAQILDGLQWLERETTQHDVAMIFASGHGYDDEYGDYYLLPADVDVANLRRTAVPRRELETTLERLVGKALLFLDTCHAGRVHGRRSLADVDIDRLAAELSAAENGVIVFASASGNQVALESGAWGNGAFTKALVEGLEGRADYDGDRAVSITELDLWLARRVKALTDGRQTPVTAKPTTVRDFPIAAR